MIIDDDRGVIALTSKILSQSFADCRIVTAETGQDGLNSIRSEMPDIIILDMVLPDISGLEVCRAIKNDKKIRHIPVIIMTGACKESRHMVDGLETGADYYIHKPFEQNEFTAQVKATLRIKQSEDLLRVEKQQLQDAFRKQTKELSQSRKALAQKVAELESLVERQTQELIRADRLAAMGILAAGIAHEVNNPNTFIISNLQTFRMFWDYVEKVLDTPNVGREIDADRLNFIRGEMPGLLKGMEEGSRRIASIVTGMKNYISGNQADNRVVDIREVVESALGLIWNQIKHDIEVRKEFTDDLPPIFGSEQLLCQVFVNLFLNAANVMKEYRGEGVLSVKGYRENNYSVITVSDNGPGMEPEVMKNLFNPFFTTRRGHGGTGLGLFVSHGIIKGHNGLIEVESRAGSGAAFHLKLPAIEKDQTLAADVEHVSIEPEQVSAAAPAAREG